MWSDDPAAQPSTEAGHYATTFAFDLEPESSTTVVFSLQLPDDVTTLRA